MQILEVDLNVFETRREVIQGTKAEHKTKYFENEEKICVYIVDLDGTMLKTEQLKSQFADTIDERNFRNAYCDRSIKIKREI